MNRFQKSIAFFLSLFLSILTIQFYVINGSFEISPESVADKIFYKKVKLFEKFIIGKKSINLILGSSITEDAIIPDSLGSNWYSFTNSRQNIYQC